MTKTLAARPIKALLALLLLTLTSIAEEKHLPIVEAKILDGTKAMILVKNGSDEDVLIHNSLRHTVGDVPELCWLELKDKDGILIVDTADGRWSPRLPSSYSLSSKRFDELKIGPGDAVWKTIPLRNFLATAPVDYRMRVVWVKFGCRVLTESFESSVEAESDWVKLEASIHQDL